MEKSILDQDQTKMVSSRVDAVSNKIDRINSRYSPILNANTGYDRNLEDTPMDDYEYRYLLDKDNPEETLKDKSYLKDAWTTFMNDRDQINLMSERAKLVKDINPVLEDIDYELQFLDHKQRVKNLENIIPTLEVGSEEHSQAISEYNNLTKTLADQQEQYNAILNKYDDSEGTDLEKRKNALNNRKQELLKEREEVGANIQDYYSSLKNRTDNYKPSSDFQIKEQLAQDKPWYSPDYVLYAGPGLTGSSTATVEGYLSSALATGALWLGRHYAATGALNAAPPTAAFSNIVGWGNAITATAINLAGNLYSRHRESLAQVYGAYRSKIEKQLQDKGLTIQEYAQAGREALAANDPNIEADKISDEEIIDRVLSGDIAIDDDTLNSAKKSSNDGLQRVYDNNMALSAMDVAESALLFAPLGKAMGKVISAPVKMLAKPLSKLPTKTLSKYHDLIDAYTGFNARLALNSPTKYASLQAAKTLTKMGFVATGEAFEEGNQDIFDYDYIAGKYDDKSTGILQSLMGLANANYRVAKIISGIDTESELANDPQFWNDIKGGFALGLYMGGPISAYHGGIKTYKDLSANRFVRDVIADQIGKKDAMNKAVLYADRANKKLNYQENVLEVLENYKLNLPEGITEEDIDEEIATAESVFSLAKSKTNKDLAKSIGYTAGTTEYNAMIGLQHMAQLDAQEAIDNFKTAEAADNQIYTNLINNPALSNYNEEEKLAATTLTKLNIQKLTLEQLKTALESGTEEGKQKFGVTDKENPVAKSLLKQLPDLIKKIDEQLAEVSKDTKFSTGFIAAPDAVQTGVDSYINVLMAQHDSLIAQSKMQEIFGNAFENGKLVNFRNASPETKANISKAVKSRIDKYLNDSEESTRVVEENAKQVVEAEAAKEAQKQAVASEDGSITTDNETPIASQIERKEAEEKPNVPQTPIMDSRVKPTGIDTHIPEVDTSMEEEEGIPQKGVEELVKELKVEKPKKEKQEQKKQKEQEEEETDLDDYDEIEVYADSKQLGKVANDDADPLSDEDKAVKTTAETMPKEPTVQQRLEKAERLIETAKRDDKLEEADSDSRKAANDFDNFLQGVLDAANDKVSHTLFFNPESNTPMMKGTKTGKELAEQIKNPKFFEESFCEFIINEEYTEPGSKPYKAGDPSTYNSASIVMLVHHSTGTYAMALKTPKGANTLLTGDRAFIELQQNPTQNAKEIETLNEAINIAVANLTEFRNAVITAIENKLPNETVVPGAITRTNGEYNVNRDSNNRAILRPIQEVKGLGIPEGVYDITPENVEFGISSGVANNRIVLGSNGEILPGTGGSGQLFIYPPQSSVPSGRKVSIQINLKRFSKLEAEFIANMVIAYGANPSEEYRDTGVPTKELLNFMVRFGDATKIDTQDPRFDWLKEKQFYIDDRGMLVIGDKKYDRGNLSSSARQEIVNSIMNMHWRVDRSTFFSPLHTALPSIAEKFKSDSNLEYITPSDLGGFPFSFGRKGMFGNEYHGPLYTMGFMVDNKFITSDLQDELFKDSFAYATDLQVVPKELDNKENVEKTNTKVENLQIANPQVSAQETDTTTSLEKSNKEKIQKITKDGTVDPFAIDDSDLDYPTRKISKPISATVTKEEINWFKNKLGLSGESLTIVEDAIALGNSEYAMGLVRENATILWEGAEVGTLYHEAFHRVSLLLISPKERKRIYEFYRRQNNFQGTDKELEEALAEDFRQYMLNKADADLNIVKRALKAIKNFVTKWVWKTDTTIDNIFDRINRGYYNRFKQNSEAVNEFLNTYKGQGAPFKYRGHNFKHISNSQFKEVTNSLLAALFSLSNVKMRDDLSKLDYGILKAALDPELTAKLVKNGTLTKEQSLARNEIFETFDSVFKTAITEKIANYGVRAIDREQDIDDEINEKEIGNAVGDQMSDYIKSSLEFSAKDNALAAIKIFVATMPKREFVEVSKQNPDGTVSKIKKAVPVKSTVTGLPLMNDFDTSWNVIINELHSENTFQGMLEKASKLSKVYPIFDTLWKELYKISKVSEGETENQKIARENLQTQFRNTFRKSKQKLVGILSEKIEDPSGKEQTNLYVKDESSNKVSKNVLQAWNYNLERNGSLIHVVNDQFQVVKDENGKSAINEVISQFNNISDVFKKYSTQPTRKLKNGQTYKEYVAENLDTIKNKLLDLLNTAGLSVDMDTINSYLTQDYYNPNPVDSFSNFILNGNKNSVNSFFNSKLKTLNSIDTLGNVTDKYVEHVSKFYNKSKFAGRISEIYGITHPSSDELSVLSTDGKLLYPISDHNYLTDMTQNLDTDHSTVEKLATVLYNTGNNQYDGYFKGSYLLTNLYNNPAKTGKLEVETFVYFKEQGSTDKGRKYTEISPLEDYVAKLTFTMANRIVLPTMGDSQTYNTIKGTAVNNFNQPLDLSNREIKFDSKVLKRFIGYFETELDTIEFNYKNEPNMSPEQKIKNYDTGARNGYRFRYFNGFFKLREVPTAGGIEFEQDFSNFNDALSISEDLGGGEEALNIVNQIRSHWNKMSSKDKAMLMNNYLLDAFKDELDYANELGIIKWDGRKILSVKNLALPQSALTNASKHYEKQTEFAKYSENLGALELLANHFANTISSVIEFEKLYIKDPAYYKDSVDKIKRLREVLSTGVTPRIDYESGNPMADLTEANVGTLSDNYVVSRQADTIKKYAKRSAAIKLLQEMKGMSFSEAVEFYDNNELPQDVNDAAEVTVNNKFGVYFNPKGKINQTDATVLISPEFYKELVRRVDGWTPEVAKAFDILNNPEVNYESDPDLYNEALAVTLKPLKFMYFGDHYDNTLKRDIPVFDKMAMFPVHRIFSTGDIKTVLDVMNERNVHMLAFESAVKVGQRVEEVKSKIYTDKTNDTVDKQGLMNMPIHKQSLANFRRQLITDPHHADRQMFVSQAQKAAMGNIRNDWKYTTPDGEVYSGAEVAANITSAQDAITKYGRKEIENDFGVTPDNPQVSVVRFAEIMQSKAINSNMNDNVVDGLSVVKGKTVAPISGLSDNSWIESSLISMINKSIVDTNLPGGMFIQMSSILYNKLTVHSDSGLQRKLNFANEDGSMDCVISINLLKHIIPNYDSMTFSGAKKWLIDKEIIGPDTKALAMGYRIPAQGQSSTAALKVVDVYPEQIGDTITLPDEFTALTGSDFDIDKLFVARYNYDSNGNKIKLESKEQYIERLRNEGLDDETIVRKAYEQYGEENGIFANQKEAYENLLLDMYLSVISNPLNFSEARQPLDVVTDYLNKHILIDVDDLTGQTKRANGSQLYYATPAFQSRTKAELNGGKVGIGPFALANAHHVLTQLVKLTFKPNKVLNAYGIQNLHSIQSKDRNKINVLDWLSALINAHVDVAKDPYIIRLNVRKLTFNMTNFLIRTGKGESTFYYLPQQILKDFATEYDKYSGFYSVDIPSGRNPETLARNAVWRKYYAEAHKRATAPQKQLLEHLKTAGLSDKDRKKMFDVSYLRDQLSKKNDFNWYYNQLKVMKAYEELDQFSRSLSELTNLSQIDTKRYGNNFGLQSAFLDKWKQYMTEQSVFEDPQKVFFNTFLGQKMIDGLIFPRNAFQNVMIRLTPEFEKQRSFIEYYTKGYAIKDDTYINNITRAMEVAYKMPFFDKHLSKSSSEHLEPELALNRMLYGNTSISRRLDKLKSDIRLGKYPELQGNVLLDNVFSRPKTNETELAGPDFLAYKPNKSGDHNLENEVIRAWEELYDNDNKEIRDFARDLAVYSFYTSGDAFGKNNIFRYVPNSIREEIGYFDYIRNLENNPENATSQINIAEVIRNLWWNDHVVPTMEYYRLDSSNETIMDEGRPVYRTQPHEDSGFTVENDKGKILDIPGIIYDEASSKNGIIGYNKAGLPIFPLYKKVKLDRSSNPKTTFLYKYLGLTSESVPVYKLINKKGLNYNGNVLMEFGKKRSSIPYNNVVPAGYRIMPEEEITIVKDVIPIKASLQAKVFNNAGEFNPDQLIPQSNATATVDSNVEPLSYQEWRKDFQSMGEEAAQQAYQQYLDNFAYNSKEPVNSDNEKLVPGTELRTTYVNNSGGALGSDSYNFAGIGTRELNSYGKQAIEDVFTKTFGNADNTSIHKELKEYANESKTIEYDSDSTRIAQEGLEIFNLKDIENFEVEIEAPQFDPLLKVNENKEDSTITFRFAIFGKTDVQKRTTQALPVKATYSLDDPLIKRYLSAKNASDEAYKNKTVEDAERATPLEAFTENAARRAIIEDVVASIFPDYNSDRRKYFRSRLDTARAENATSTDSALEESKKQLSEHMDKFGYSADAMPSTEDLSKAVEEAKVVQENYTYTFSDGYEVSTNFQLNDQQKEALAALEAFVNSSSPTITLSGYAGTGKTTIVGIFYEWLKRRTTAPVIFSAPTHRANAVTRQNTPGAKVMTLQSLLGLRPDIDITETDFNLRKLKFQQITEDKMGEGSIIFIDEASMIQDGLYDLLQTVAAQKDAQIIYMGDKGQLRPVKSSNISKVFTENESAQIQLTKVERTGDNPILKESTRVRKGEGLSYITDINEKGQGVKYSSDSATVRAFVKQMIDETDSSKDPLHFRILAATNDLVHSYNLAYRTLKYGKRPNQVYQGELLMGYANKMYNRYTGTYKLINSGDYVVTDVAPTKIEIRFTESEYPEVVTMEGYNLTLRDAADNSASPFGIGVISNFEADGKIIKVKNYIDSLWRKRKEALAAGNRSAAAAYVKEANLVSGSMNTMKNITDENGNLIIAKSLDYGYAHTIHKSQGGTYSKVLVIDDSIETFGPDNKSGKEIREELRYVAVSRAKNFVFVKTQDNKVIKQTVEESTEDLYDDDIVVYATPQMLRNTASQDAMSELSKLGQQRKNECK